MMSSAENPPYSTPTSTSDVPLRKTVLLTARRLTTWLAGLACVQATITALTYCFIQEPIPGTSVMPLKAQLIVNVVFLVVATGFAAWRYHGVLALLAPMLFNTVLWITFVSIAIHLDKTDLTPITVSPHEKNIFLITWGTSSLLLLITSVILTRRTPKT